MIDISPFKRTFREVVHDWRWELEKVIFRHPENAIRNYEKAIWNMRVLKREDAIKTQALKRSLSKTEWRELQDEIRQLHKKR